MRSSNIASEKCQISGELLPMTQLVPAKLVRPALVETIKIHIPTWDEDGYVSKRELDKYRSLHLERILDEEHVELASLNQNVLDSINKNELLSADEGIIELKERTFAARLSDKMAEFGGSWGFLISFLMLLVIWISFNAWFAADKAFDPFPFILLNLVLSTIAAVQAPIIMMSQNRLEAKDRHRAESDYKINLKAELEIRHLHEKMDHLLMNQWERTLELQRTLFELRERLSK